MMTIANILLVLWLLGLVTGTTLGGFIYVLLVVAAVLFPMRLMGGRGAAARGPQARSHDRWNAPVPLEGTGAYAQGGARRLRIGLRWCVAT